MIAVHILAYNVDRFLVHVIENAGAHVDRIYIVVPETSWRDPNTGAVFPNRTDLSVIEASRFSDRIVVLHGQWDDEAAMRNTCLERAIADGMSWLIVQDADEFYTHEAWLAIRHALHYCPDEVQAFRTTMYTFWKSTHFVLVERDGSIKSLASTLAVRCRPDLRFTRLRITNAATMTTLDAGCFHYSYVLNDAELAAKLATWGHASEVDAGRWLKYKWGRWTERSRNLHPVFPPLWPRAIRFPGSQPDFAHTLAVDVNQDGSRNLPGDVGGMMYDLRHAVRFHVRQLYRYLLRL